MNYPNTVAQRSYYRQAPRRKTRHYVVDWTKLAMLIIPIVLLAVILTLAFSSHGTDTTPKLDTVQAQGGGNGINPGGNVEGDLLSVSLLPYTQQVTEQPKEETETAPLYTDREVELIAKTVYGEALVTQSDMEMAAVAWCILNRVDSPKYPDTIEEVVTQRRQFHGYSEEHPVIPRVENLVRDVLDRWYAEKNGDTDCGRVLPKDYIYFEGDGRHNHYSTEWLSNEFYDWSLPNPYKN